MNMEDSSETAGFCGTACLQRSMRSPRMQNRRGEELEHVVSMVGCGAAALEPQRTVVEATFPQTI